MCARLIAVASQQPDSRRRAAAVFAVHATSSPHLNTESAVERAFDSGVYSMYLQSQSTAAVVNRALAHHLQYRAFSNNEEKCQRLASPRNGHIIAVVIFIERPGIPDVFSLPPPPNLSFKLSKYLEMFKMIWHIKRFKHQVKYLIPQF